MPEHFMPQGAGQAGTGRTVVTGGCVMTLDERLGDLPRGAVLIEDGRIVAVEGSADAFSGSGANVIDARGGIILPGMVDSHRHTWMALLRALSADVSLPHFLATHFHGIGSIVQAEDMGIATLVGALEALDAGVTTLLDCCDCVNTPDHADAAVESLRASGLRAIYGYGLISYPYQPPAFAGHADRLRDATRLRSSMLPSDDGLVRMGMLVNGFGNVPHAHTAAEIRLARELDVLSASHTGAVPNSILLKGLRDLKDLGLLRAGHLHIHCSALTHPEWRLLADSGARVSISPETEMQMGMGFPPFRACLEHGILPSFSTDIVCVGSGDLFSQMRLGLQFQRCMDNDAVHRRGAVPFEIELSVRDALDWATRGGAQALGLDAQVGSLTPGKRADLIIVSQDRAFVPSSHPAGTVVLQTTAADVDTVLVDGQIRKRHGRLVGHDLEAIRGRARQALERLQRAAAAVRMKSLDEIPAWFAQAERKSAKNFAGAYEHFR